MNTHGIFGHEGQIGKCESLRASGSIPQAMFFSGVSGIGKKLVAERFLNSLFCEDNNPPCLKCRACLQVRNDTFPDMIVLRPDEKGKIPLGSNDKREEGSVRWLIDRLSKKSLSGRYGVLIDGVNRISIAGQNALLKTIEEPPENTHCILIASHRSQVLPTILSRCVEIHFYPLPESSVAEILENKGSPPDTARLIAGLSGGSAEIALLLADPEIRTGIFNLCGEISDYLGRGVPLSLELNVVQKKTGAENLINILLNTYRALLHCSIHGKEPDPALKSLEVRDTEKLKKLMKILLAERRWLPNNLNIRFSLKGMLYAMDELDFDGIPEKNYAMEL